VSSDDQAPTTKIDTSVPQTARVWNYWLGGKDNWNESANPPYAMRSPEEIAGYFDDLELVDPGLVDVTRWRPDPSPSGPPRTLDNLVGVARKPAKP
jgi:hypothetical protein